jgi:hypothetical protein
VDKKEAAAAFNEMDANCNACRHLIRVPSDKHVSRVAGLLWGRCGGKMDVAAHPYADRMVDGVFPFAPSDWQGMPCWESRAAPQEIDGQA